MSIQEASALDTPVGSGGFVYEHIIDQICELKWVNLTEQELISVAWAYYHFSYNSVSVLKIARELYPDDSRLLQLDHGERDTDIIFHLGRALLRSARG